MLQFLLLLLRQSAKKSICEKTAGLRHLISNNVEEEEEEEEEENWLYL